MPETTVNEYDEFDDEFEEYECCDECGCYHSHFKFCSQYDPSYYPDID